MKSLLFLLLPALVSCRISVTIQATSADTSTVSTRGTDSKIISDKERITFGITDDILKDAAEKYSGGRPKDVFLHSPTPWNDLYQTYGWVQVKRIFKPVKSRLLDSRSENIIVSLKEFVNNSTVSTKFDGSITAEVENSVMNKWNKAGIFEVSDPITYNLLGSSNVSYTSPWGMDSFKSKKVVIGTNSDVEVNLKPGQAVSAALIATKVSLTIQIDYTAVLSGHVACNYPERFNGHHFWRYDINGLLGAAKLLRTVNSSEIISVKFYTDANIVVMDKDSNTKISETPAVIQ